MSNTSTTTSNFTSLSVNQLQPNPWNPNQMSDGEFAELVAEVRRLGRIPKPIVVRQNGENYEIVDGEHNYFAAQEVGLTELPCEIIEADDFEAMLQTYKRNQHGKHCCVREGRMFQTMLREREMTNGQLAEAMGISEGTVRNKLSCARAATKRNGYVGEPRDAEIDRLQIRQVRCYLDLPGPLGDYWLDAGAVVGDFKKFRDVSLYYLGKLLQKYELMEYVDSQDFRDSFARSVALAQKLEQSQDVPGFVDFVRPIAEMRLPSLLAWIIPVRRHDNQAEICLDAETWTNILEDSQHYAERPEYLMIEVAGCVCDHIEDLGINPREVYGGSLMPYIEQLLDAPDFIREADFLSLDERMQLDDARAPVSAEILEKAKRDTIAFLRAERANTDADGVAYGRGSNYVQAIFLAQLKTEMEPDGKPITPRSVDREALLRSFNDVIRWCPPLRIAVFDDRPATEVFRERIAELRTPELVVFRSLLNGALPSSAICDWMDAVQNEICPSASLPEQAPQFQPQPERNPPT